MKLILLALSFLLLGCAQPEAPKAAAPVAAKAATAPPSAAEAKTLIAESPEFSEYEFTNAAATLPLQKSAMNAPAQQLAADLKAAGWIRFDGDGAVVLTEKAKQDKRILVRPNGFADLVPLAKKELTAVIAIRGTCVDFDWRWIPNDLGAALRSGVQHDRYATPQHATATLLHDGTSWSVLRIAPR
jgi:glucose/arabinose dehydrogenase